MRPLNHLAVAASLALVMSVPTPSCADFLSADTILIGSDMTQPPYNYYDENRAAAGLDSELLTLLAKEMGRDAKFLDVRFENLILGIQGGRFDVIASAMYVRPARAEVIDFIPYMKAGISFAARSDDTNPPRQPADMCGKRVGALKGSAEIGFLTAVSGECEAGTKPAVDIREFPSSPEASQALMSGNIDAQVNDAGQLKRAVDNSQSRLVISSTELFSPAVVGLGVKKDNSQVTIALEAALDKLKETGVYAKLLEKYNVSAPTKEEFEAALRK
jgi:polar amino acid transport system substrate-binding protein